MGWILWIALAVFVLWMIGKIIHTIRELLWVARCEREYQSNPEFRAYIDELDQRIKERKANREVNVHH